MISAVSCLDQLSQIPPGRTLLRHLRIPMNYGIAKEFYGSALLEILNRMHALQSIECIPNNGWHKNVPTYEDITKGLEYFGPKFSGLVQRELRHVKEITVDYPHIIHTRSSEVLFVLWLTFIVRGRDGEEISLLWIAMLRARRNGAWVSPTQQPAFPTTMSLNMEVCNDFLRRF